MKIKHNFIFEILNSNKAEACTISSGVVSESDINSGCDTAPAEYEIVIYKLFILFTYEGNQQD